MSEVEEAPKDRPVEAQAERSGAELPSALLAEVASGGGPRWLIEQVWAAQGVGLVGGSPKTGKTWIALDLALSVASGTPALGMFPVLDQGRVLIYPAEDRPGAVRDRVEGLCRARGLDLALLPLHIVTAESLRLDVEDDRAALESLLARLRPKMLLLDPLVRLHGGDENSATHVSQLLGYLRKLQRRFALAILVTHHISKRSHAHPGQALRGSSDLHAWGDSNLYLHRQKNGPTLLSIEHRFASSPEALAMRIAPQPGGGAHIELCRVEVEAEAESSSGRKVERQGGAPTPLRERILGILERASAPVSQAALRRMLKVNNQRLTDALRTLQGERQIENLGHMAGWRWLDPSSALDRAPVGDDLAADGTSA